jgi:hypothetical protein
VASRQGREAARRGAAKPNGKGRERRTETETGRKDNDGQEAVVDVTR